MSDWSYFLKVNPRYSVSYCRYTGTKSGRFNSGKWLTTEEVDVFKKAKPRSSGQMSKKAQSRLVNCFQWLLMISNKKKVYSKKENITYYFRINFITLTLSNCQFHSDQFIKNHMLSPFLKFLKRSWNVNSYIWKAEAQKNGRMHFHITTNKFVHWRAIRNKWNSLQYKYGYILLDDYLNNTVQKNSTDVHSVRNEVEASKYMVKYMYKNEKDKRAIHGKLWDASENLNESSLVLEETNGNYNTAISTMEDEKITQTILKDHCKLYIYKRKIFNFLPISLREHFTDRINSLREQDQPQWQVTIDSIY